MVGSAPTTSLLDAAIASGALEVVGAAEIPPTTFTEAELEDPF